MKADRNQQLVKAFPVLNPAVKRKWVKALRSGDYAQGEGALTDTNDKGGQEFCCLGVLACVVDPGKNTWDEVTDHYFGGIDSDGDVPNASSFAKQVELLGGEPLPAGMVSKLGKFNDEGKSFKWIASYIERYL